MSLFSCVKGKKEGSTHVVCVCVVVSSRVRERKKKERNKRVGDLILSTTPGARSFAFVYRVGNFGQTQL